MYDLNNDLKNLELKFPDFCFAGSNGDMKKIEKGIKFLPDSIRSLYISFSGNLLGYYEENLRV